MNEVMLASVITYVMCQSYNVNQLLGTTRHNDNLLCCKESLFNMKHYPTQGSRTVYMRSYSILFFSKCLRDGFLPIKN